MILGISEDFTSNVDLDSQLKAVPDSGLYVNVGVHPSITVENLLSFLPKLDITFTAWDDEVPYGVFLESKNRRDVVTRSNKIFESVTSGVNQDPETADSIYWIETNIESLRLKIFLQSVKEKVFADLNLNKRLINSQFLYENGEYATTLPNDYAAWVLEPKGSDYVSFRVNQVSLQKSGTAPVNLYVIREGVLLDTVQITPSNGKLNFVDTNIILSGKGRFYLAIDSTEVFVGHATIDPLKFDGFVVYTATGIGDTPEGASYTYQTIGNGLGINVTAFLDASQYIENNLQDFGSFVRAVFEYMTFKMFQSNPNNRSNRAERIQMSDEVLLAELKRLDGDTVARRYYHEKKQAIKMLEKTFDTQLSSQQEGIEIRQRSV